MVFSESAKTSVFDSKANILLVDARLRNLLYLRTILEGLGQNIVEARSADEALKSLRGAEFAVVLLSVHMAGVGGLETAELLRADEQFRHTPIIFIAGYESDELLVEEAYSLGAIDYLVEPIVPIILRSKVKGLVESFSRIQQVKNQAFVQRQTERREFERKLAIQRVQLSESESRLEAIMEQASFCVHVFGPDGRTLRVNRAWKDVWNATFDQMRDYNILEDSELAELGVLDELKSAFKGQVVHLPLIPYDPVRGGLNSARQEGGQHWTSAVAYPVKGADGEIAEVVLVHQDVTSQKQAADDLKECERRFRQLADSMPQIVWTVQMDGSVDYFNRRWYEYTGLPHTGIRNDWTEVLHPSDVDLVNRRWSESLRSGVAFEMEMRLKEGLTGQYRWHRARSLPIGDDTGRIVRWYGTSTDIHEHKLSSDASRFLVDATEALGNIVDYETTLQTIAHLAVPYFADWCAVDVDQGDNSLRRLAAAHLDPEKVRIAQELTDRYPPDLDAPGGIGHVFRTGRSEIVRHLTDEMLAEGAQDSEHLRLLRALAPNSYLCVPLRISGRIAGVFSFIASESGRQFNNSDLMLAEELSRRTALAIENSELCRKLRDADHRKEEFLAALAHELRNPLAPIQNSIEILKSSRADVPTVSRVMAMMERQVQHLVRLVDEVRDASSVMRGKVEVRRQLVELASVVANSVQASEAIIKDRQHELSISLPSSTLMLDADPVRLAQVVENLLTNAAKFTPPGGRISLAARRDDGFVELVVRDNGIGIQREMLPRIFELSAPTSSNHAVTRGGLGVGLTIAQNLVAQDHGTILASSPGPGKGSEFRVRLPLANHGKFSESRPTVLDSASQTTADICRLLVVDDNRDAAVSLAMLLRIIGHDVRVAHDGPSALELASNFRPELAFLDLGMPGMDGFEVATRLQKQTPMSNIVLVALTGWGQPQDRQRTKAAGFHHHYVKPMEFDALDRLMSNFRKQQRN